MTFASRMQHLIYWGPLKKPIEWSLKTVLAPWSYIASVVYHDSFWYPMNADRLMARRARRATGAGCSRTGDAASKADANGYPDVGAARPRSCDGRGAKAFASRSAMLGTCVREAPEFANRKRKVVAHH